MIYTIEEIKEKTIPIAKKYGIDSMSLFGSYARGEATENSDVDFYIDKGDIKGLLDYIGFGWRTMSSLASGNFWPAIPCG